MVDENENSEISYLFQKYAGGAIPRLVDFDHPNLGLIDLDLLKRVIHGTMSMDDLTLGLLIAADKNDYKGQKWLEGDYQLNDEVKSNWPKRIRL